MRRDQRVSIAMPVYNGGDHFALALESALAQTYSDIEILVVDDGSTDGGHTTDIGRRYEAQHPGRVRFFTKKNGGVASALNKAAEEMTGDLFCWLSHDDLFLPDKTERQVKFFNELGGNSSIVYSHWSYIDENGEPLYPVMLDGDRLSKSNIQPVIAGCLNGCTMMIPREIIRSNPFDLRYRFVQDYRLWWRLAREYGMYLIPEVTVLQRLHPGQDSHKPQALVEGNALWTDMVREPVGPERLQLYGSSYLFYKAMAAWLRQTPYEEARQVAEQRAEKAFNDPDLTLYVGRQESAATSASLAAIRSAGIDVVASFDSQGGLPGLERHSDDVARQRAIELGDREFVLFVEDAADLQPDALIARARWAKEAGAKIAIEGERDEVLPAGPSAVLALSRPGAKLVNRHAAVAYIGAEEVGWAALALQMARDIDVHVYRIAAG